MKFNKKIIAILFATSTLFFYQNCSSRLDSISATALSSTEGQHGETEKNNENTDSNLRGTNDSNQNTGDVDQITDENTDSPLIIPSTEGKTEYSSTFSEIKKDGLRNACYPSTDHYIAEFLFQNPDACFWKLEGEIISKVPIPSIPSNALELPEPSGGDDTKKVEEFINSNPGKSLYGNSNGKQYKISNLKINVKINIFDMPMVTANKSANVVVINSPDVRIYNSPIDGQNSSSTAVGFLVNDKAHRFVLVKSGFSNIHHKQKISASGVKILAANDFHITCNSFKNIVNDIGGIGSKSTSEKVKLKVATARANAVWMNGGKDGTTSGGVIANNYGENFQSNGSRNDAEFFTIQAYEKTDKLRPVKFFANRGVNAGKRMTKSQESDLVVLSNKYEWPDKQGPLGSRSLFAAVNIHFSDNVIARNNRFVVGAQSKFDNIFLTNLKGRSKTQNNIHFDCNDIEIKDKLSATSNNIPIIIGARTDDAKDANFKYEATNSSANNNVVHGNGSIKYFYFFDDGYRKDGGLFEIKNNTFEINFNSREFK